MILFHERSDVPLAKAMRVTKGSPAARVRYTIHQLLLPQPMRAGDLIIVTAECQIESKLPYAVGIGSHIIISPDVDGGVQFPVCDNAGDNIENRTDHYEFAVRAGQLWITSKESGCRYVIFQMWAHSSKATSTARVAPKPRGSHLAATVFRG